MPEPFKKIKANEWVFREGDASDAMFVIRFGRIAIVKTKGNGEVVLAEKLPGEMLGEMAFFDGKSRSAGAKALEESEVVILPFTSLHAQFRTFPEWLKAMVRTVNSQLREANVRIKNIESQSDSDAFPPHTITKIMAIITLVGYKAGEKGEGGVIVPHGVLNEYCTQIFQQPTHKLEKVMEVLTTLGHMKIDELGQGHRRITILRHKLLSDFTDFYNKYLFSDVKERVTIAEGELNPLRALVHFGRAAGTLDEHGFVKVNLNHVQKKSPQDLNFNFDPVEAEPLFLKGLVEQARVDLGGDLSLRFKLGETEVLLRYWEIIHALRALAG